MMGTASITNSDDEQRNIKHFDGSKVYKMGKTNHTPEKPELLQSLSFDSSVPRFTPHLKSNYFANSFLPSANPSCNWMKIQHLTVYDFSYFDQFSL